MSPSAPRLEEALAHAQFLRAVARSTGEGGPDWIRLV